MCYESRLASIPIHARYVVIFTSILLKNSSCHLHRRRFSKSESECKDKAFLSFPPNLFRSFFKLFFSRPRLKGPAGKDRRQHRQNAATAWTRRPLVSPPSFRFSGCKDKANFIPFPNFLQTFFQNFPIITGNQSLAWKNAAPGTGREEGRGEGITLLPRDSPDSRTLPNAFDTALIRKWYGFDTWIHRIYNP